jgi:hypothetical protein
VGVEEGGEVVIVHEFALRYLHAHASPRAQSWQQYVPPAVSWGEAAWLVAQDGHGVSRWIPWSSLTSSPIERGDEG